MTSRSSAGSTGNTTSSRSGIERVEGSLIASLCAKKGPELLQSWFRNVPHLRQSPTTTTTGSTPGVMRWLYKYLLQDVNLSELVPLGGGIGEDTHNNNEKENTSDGGNDHVASSAEQQQGGGGNSQSTSNAALRSCHHELPAKGTTKLVVLPSIDYCGFVLLFREETEDPNQQFLVPLYLVTVFCGVQHRIRMEFLYPILRDYFRTVAMQCLQLIEISEVNELPTEGQDLAVKWTPVVQRAVRDVDGLIKSFVGNPYRDLHLTVFPKVVAGTMQSPSPPRTGHSPTMGYITKFSSEQVMMERRPLPSGVAGQRRLAAIVTAALAHHRVILRGNNKGDVEMWLRTVAMFLQSDRRMLTTFHVSETVDEIIPELFLQGTTLPLGVVSPPTTSSETGKARMAAEQQRKKIRDAFLDRIHRWFRFPVCVVDLDSPHDTPAHIQPPHLTQRYRTLYDVRAERIQRLSSPSSLPPESVDMLKDDGVVVEGDWESERVTIDDEGGDHSGGGTGGEAGKRLGLSPLTKFSETVGIFCSRVIRVCDTVESHRGATVERLLSTCRICGGVVDPVSSSSEELSKRIVSNPEEEAHQASSTQCCGGEDVEGGSPRYCSQCGVPLLAASSSSFSCPTELDGVGPSWAQLAQQMLVPSFVHWQRTSQLIFYTHAVQIHQKGYVHIDQQLRHGKNSGATPQPVLGVSGRRSSRTDSLLGGSFGFGANRKRVKMVPTTTDYDIGCVSVEGLELEMSLPSLQDAVMSSELDRF